MVAIASSIKKKTPLATFSGLQTILKGVLDSIKLFVASYASSPNPDFNHSPSMKPGQIALIRMGPKALARDLVIMTSAPFEAT